MSLFRAEDNEPGPTIKKNIELLERVPLFSGFPTRVIKLLSYLCKTSTFEAGDIVIDVGDDRGLAAYVNSGRIGMIFHDGQEERVGRTYGKGEFFGGLSLMSKYPSLFILKALEPTEALLLTSEEFAGVLEQFPELHGLLLKNILQQLRSWDRELLRTAGGASLEAGVSLL